MYTYLDIKLSSHNKNIVSSYRMTLVFDVNLHSAIIC